jgi:hypothetical protein
LNPPSQTRLAASAGLLPGRQLAPMQFMGREGKSHAAPLSYAIATRLALGMAKRVRGLIGNPSDMQKVLHYFAEFAQNNAFRRTSTHCRAGCDSISFLEYTTEKPW